MAANDESVLLLQRLSDELVEAKLRSVTRAIAKQIDSEWWNIGGSRSLRQSEGDHSWRWSDIFGEYRNQLFWNMKCVQTADGEIQGGIGFWSSGKSLIENDLGAVFVHYLATAPHNRPWLIAEPKYRGVGIELLLHAVKVSWNLGFEGRVTLVSLPSERTTAFYKKRGFTVISTDDEGMMELELEPAAARAWLFSTGYL